MTWEYPTEEIQAILTLAETLTRLPQEGFSYRAFDTGLAISIFRDNSTRTRFSFASAASAMGFSLSDLDEEKSQVAHGETVRETANMISFLTEVIGIRDDMFLGKATPTFAKWAMRLNTARGRVCCTADPASSISSATSTIAIGGSGLAEEPLRRSGQSQGKKIAMSWAYSPSYDKPLSCPRASSA